MEIKNLPEVFVGLKESLSKRKDKPDIPISLESLNEILWGIHKRELMIIAARPSQGKSSLALQFARDTSDKGFVTYLVSLEMTKESLLERLFCHVVSMSNSIVRKGYDIEKVKSKFGMFEEYIEGTPLLILDNIGFKYKDFEKIIALNPKPDVLIIDYVQQISTLPGMHKHDMIEEYIKDVKRLCMERNFAAIVCSQINRESDKRASNRPTLADLKGSGALEEASDTVLLLHYPYKYSNDIKHINDYEINVAKQRHGATGLVRVSFHPQYYWFSDLTI